METDYPYSTLVNFSLSPNSSPWNLDRFDVASKFMRIIENPDCIDQNGFGCCGEVAFLRSWIYRDPDAVTRFATDLFNNGWAYIRKANDNSTDGRYKVTAANELLKSDYFRRNPNATVTSAVWMICGALADTEDDYAPKFGGNPDEEFSLSTMASEVASWLNATGCYYLVDHNLCAFNETTGNILTALIDILTGFPFPNFSDSQTIDDACTNLDPEHQDVILAINTNMFKNLISSDPPTLPSQTDAHSGLTAFFPSHWVMLDKKIEKLGNDRYRLNIWTWGKKYTITVSKDVFNDNYFGAIRAHTLDPRRMISAKETSTLHIPNIWYTPRNTLEFDWWIWDFDHRINWMSIRDDSKNTELAKYLGDFVNITSGIYREDPFSTKSTSAIGEHSHYSTNIPDLNDPHSHKYSVHSFFYPLEGCSLLPSQQDSKRIQPSCHTKSKHFRFSYFAYKSPDQIRDGNSHKGVELKTAGGRLLGRCAADGKIEITGDKTTIPVYSEDYIPDYIAKIAIALEYCFYWLNYCKISFIPESTNFQIYIQKRKFGPTFNRTKESWEMSFDPQLTDEQIISEVFDNLISNNYYSFSGIRTHNFGFPWSESLKSYFQDLVLKTEQFDSLIKSFMKHPETGAMTTEGSAVFWEYLNGLSILFQEWGKMEKDDIFMPDDYVEFMYSDDKKIVYNDRPLFADFAVAMGGLLLSKIPQNHQFTFGSYQNKIPKPPYTEKHISSKSPVSFEGNLNKNACGLSFNILKLDEKIPNIQIDYKATNNTESLLQIVLIDSNENILDIIRTDKIQYSRIIGLGESRQDTSKILFIVANRCNNYPYEGASLQYSIQTTPIKEARDVMITRANNLDGKEGIYLAPDEWDFDTKALWFTYEDGSNRDEINVYTDSALSVVHVRLFNFGNLDTKQVRINLYFQAVSKYPPYNDRILMQLKDFRTAKDLPNGLVVDIPKRSSIEVTAKWYCPLRPKKDDRGYVTARPPVDSNWLSFYAELEFLKDADQSPDNNYSTKGSAHLNYPPPPSIKLPEFHKVWVEIPKIVNKDWGVQVFYDGTDISSQGGILSKNVQIVGQKVAGDPNISFVGIKANVQKILAVRNNPSILSRSSTRIMNPQRISKRWDIPVDAKTDYAPITIQISSKNRVIKGCKIKIPATK